MSHSSKTFYNPGSGFYVTVITRVLCRFKHIVLGRKTINLPYERTTALRLTAKRIGILWKTSCEGHFGRENPRTKYIKQHNTR